jgi:hypothetical protein
MKSGKFIESQYQDSILGHMHLSNFDHSVSFNQHQYFAAGIEERRRPAIERHRV